MVPYITDKNNTEEEAVAMLPKDPIMLLSTVNMKLRDHHSTLEDFCLSHNVDQESLVASLAKADFHYDPATNQFR